MGMTIRHVVLVSAVLSVGSFVYVVGFSPMDESVYARAGAIDQVPGRSGLITTIRRSLAQGQLKTADRMADVLVEHNPEEPGSYFWRALVYRQMGEDESALQWWKMLDTDLASISAWPGRYSASQLDYFRAWGKFGIGEVEESQAIFLKIATDLEERSGGETGEVTDSGVLYNLACYRSMGGELELALEHWKRALEQGYVLGDGWWAADPDLEPVQCKSRFWDMKPGGRDRDRFDSGHEQEVDG
ncbi:hypothetical protein COB72_07345 [bacterium]|nr:MAG: hypothetical protein COB72_07345 [bacterium]